MFKIISLFLLSFAVANALSIRGANEEDEELSVLENVGEISEEDRADLATALALAEVAPELLEDDGAIAALSNAAPAKATKRGPFRNLARFLGLIKKVKNRPAKKLAAQELGARSISDTVEQVRDQEDLRQEVGDLLHVDTAQLEEMAETQTDVIQKLGWCILCLRCPFKLCQACLFCKK